MIQEQISMHNDNILLKHYLTKEFLSVLFSSFSGYETPTQQVTWKLGQLAQNLEETPTYDP